jgi:hypothetical protein
MRRLAVLAVALTVGVPVVIASEHHGGPCVRSNGACTSPQDGYQVCVVGALRQNWAPEVCEPLSTAQDAGKVIR